ncbi:3794_t:CDS:2 [Gigaspora margarita]|uniref:3794_t:CDS:1 n=1 Tax=Gigaspora margarita TaxID=4874 RepID=A0ABN7VEF0_GIGMA|nr:3794_t:CDS:2 [Gigaspora margarita]
MTCTRNGASQLAAESTTVEHNTNNNYNPIKQTIRNSVQPYIQNIQSIPAISVIIDLVLSRNTRIRVISIYLLSNNQKLSLKAQYKIIKWITAAQKKPQHDQQHRLLCYHETYRGNKSSQIDDIWITANLTPKCSPLSIISSEFSIASDHKILQITWYHNLNIQLPRAKQNKWRVYLYYKMNESKWEEFTKDIENRINMKHTDTELSITDEKTLNKK